MRFFHPKHTLGLVIALLLFAPAIAHGQTLDPSHVTLFTAGGRAGHVVIFLPGGEAQRDIVTTAVAAAVPRYEPLWSGGSVIPFQIVIGFLDSTHPSNDYAIQRQEWSEDVEFLQGAQVALGIEPRVCSIRVYSNFATDPHPLATIAHEVAHCYQDYYQRTSVAYVEETMKWWVEGSAEWMASLVYPSEFPNDLQTTFRHSREILRGDYNNLYWWTFLASSEGIGSEGAVIDFIRTLPADTGAYPAALEAMPGSAKEIFHRWAFALIDGRVPFNPPVDLSRMRIVDASSPGTTELRADRFSINYGRVQNFTIDPGNQAFLQADSIDPQQYAVSVRVNGTDTRLQEGQQFFFCPPADGVMLIVSRGNADAGNRTPFGLTYGQAPSDQPCDDDDEDESCLVGSWQVLEYPSTVARGPLQFDTSNFIFNFDADGTFEGDYGVSARDSDGSGVEVDVPFSGTYAVSTVEGSDTTYSVQTFDWAFEPGGRETSIARNGDRADVSAAFYNVSQDLSVWSPDGTLTCDEETLSWEPQDGSGPFELQRLS